MRELLIGFFSTTLDVDELIVAVEVPRLSPGTTWGMYKMARKPGEFAESLVVALRRPDGDELWLGAARDTPVRLRHTETVIADRPAPEITVADLLDAVGADTGSDGHSRQLHAVATLRALRAADRGASHV